MKWLAKLDTYLLEKLPLLWHTKILYALLYSIVLSSLYFVWGVSYTNYYTLTHDSIRNFLYQSNAFNCLLILNGCATIVWALSYFRKNALKNFYPLQPFYFTRLIFGLILIFWSITWPAITFESGAKMKARALAPINELQAELEIINFANAFLFPADLSYTAYLQAHHPNIERVSYDYNYKKWNKTNILMPQQFRKLDSETQYNPDLHPENTDTIRGIATQFIETKIITTKEKCNEYPSTYFVKAHHLHDLLPNELTDLRNFATQEYDSDFFHLPVFHSLAEMYDAHLNHRGYYKSTLLRGKDNHNKTFNNQFNEFLRDVDVEKVEKLLNRYEQFLQKLNIRHHLNNTEIASYVLKHYQESNYKAPAGTSVNNLSEAIASYQTYGSLEKYQEVRTKSDDYMQPLFFVEKDQIRIIFRNTFEAHTPQWNWNYILVSLYFACFAALTIFLFAISNPINVIISVAIGGVLCILNVLVFVAFLDIYSYNSEFKFFMQLVVFSLLMYGLLLTFYKSKAVHKRILLICANCCFVLSTLFPAFLMQFLDNLFKTTTYEPCHGRTTVHTFLYYWSTDPIMNLTIAIGAILIFTRWIKPLMAKPE